MTQKPGDPDYPPILPSNIRRAFHAYLTGRLTYAQYLKLVMPKSPAPARQRMTHASY